MASDRTPRTSSGGRTPKVAVVGGGIAGSVCALLLGRQGLDVSLMDMGKVYPGGRTSTRRVPAQDLQFDHGCQFFRATSPPMRQLLDEWLAAGVVAEWTPNLMVFDVPAGTVKPCSELAAEELARLGPGFFGALQPGPMYVAVPSMDTLAQHLTTACDAVRVLKTNTRVHRARWSGGQWLLAGEKVQPGSTGGMDPGLPPSPVGDWNLGSFDALVLADSMWCRAGSPGHVAMDGAPAPLQELGLAVAGLQRAPLFSVLIAWDGPPLLPGDAAVAVGGAALEWMARDTSKPGRERSDGTQCWVAVTRPDFARRLMRNTTSSSGGASGGGLPPQGPDYQQRQAQEIWAAVMQDLRPALGIRPLTKPRYLSAQRWASAFTTTPLERPAVSDAAGRWAACGDFCTGPGLEPAAMSGAAAAEAVAAMLLGRA